MKVLAIGASKNIGYYSAERECNTLAVHEHIIDMCINLLKAGHTVVFMMRSPGAFDNDEGMQKYISLGHAQVLKGDALNMQDVENAFQTASQNSPVDLVLFTVGGTPNFTLTKGLVISPPNLTTHSLSNVLQVIAASKPNPMPRLIAVTSTGATKDSHDNLPFVMKPFYSWALRSPHADKLGMERLLQHAIGMKWSESVEPVEEVLPSGWEKDYPPAGWLREIVIVRPAFLTDGEANHRYKASTNEFSSYTISRKDVAHFIGEKLPAEWETWSGKIVNLGD